MDTPDDGALSTGRCQRDLIDLVRMPIMIRSGSDVDESKTLGFESSAYRSSALPSLAHLCSAEAAVFAISASAITEANSAIE
jgi:hypothetical protein